MNENNRIAVLGIYVADTAYLASRRTGPAAIGTRCRDRVRFAPAVTAFYR